MNTDASPALRALLRSGSTVALVLYCFPVAGHTQPRLDGPRLEVISVRAVQKGAAHTYRFNLLPDGKLRVTGASLLTLTVRAFGQPPYRIQGLPDWAAEDTFDIAADASAPVTRAQLPAMLQSLLNERFLLAAHMEFRELPGYAMTFDRADRRTGPGLKPAARDCSAFIAAQREWELTSIQGSPPKDVACQPTTSPGPIGLTLSYPSTSLDALATLLEDWLKRPITNATGVHSAFDISLTVEPREIPVLSLGRVPNSGEGGDAIITALREQLGIRLERQTVLAPVLVVSSVSRPTPN